MTICCHRSNYIKMCTACCYFGTCTCCMELCDHTSQTLGTLYWPPLEKSIVAPSVRLYHFFSNQSQREMADSVGVAEMLPIPLFDKLLFLCEAVMHLQKMELFPGFFFASISIHTRNEAWSEREGKQQRIVKMQGILCIFVT